MLNEETVPKWMIWYLRIDKGRFTVKVRNHKANKLLCIGIVFTIAIASFAFGLTLCHGDTKKEYPGSWTYFGYFAIKTEVSYKEALDLTTEKYGKGEDVIILSDKKGEKLFNKLRSTNINDKAQAGLLLGKLNTIYKNIDKYAKQQKQRKWDKNEISQFLDAYDKAKASDPVFDPDKFSRDWQRNKAVYLIKAQSHNEESTHFDKHGQEAHTWSNGYSYSNRHSFSNGDKYDGEWKNGKIHGNGTMTYANGNKYMGEWWVGMRSGQGTYTWPNGDKCVGKWKDDRMHGTGTYTYFNGDKYVGKLKDFNSHGHGTYTWSSGHKYVGEWRDGERHGLGTMTYASGNKYDGEWQDDKVYGQGIYTYLWANGHKYVGECKDSKRHGHGTHTWPNGNKYVGEWKRGSASGGWFYRHNRQKTWSHMDTSGKWIHSMSGGEEKIISSGTVIVEK